MFNRLRVRCLAAGLSLRYMTCDILQLKLCLTVDAAKAVTILAAGARRLLF